ncbi:MAG: peptide-methionine (S)-S-oxide reductase MsrA [Hylemonella sp.]|nr:peptide-methionine (S)-S-oxide reductase MsrA [Hylemonella sp.]
MPTSESSSLPIITFGGGCFWCTEAIFVRVQGVIDVESGYSNGQAQRPSYEQVCSGRTGCNEVVRLVYDPAQVSVRDLLEIFFATHDPTTANRQGNDVGTQYRSAVYFSTPEQAQTAQALIAELEAGQVFGAPIVTEVLPLADYWPAEDYHQAYYEKHPDQGYCAFVVGPKVAKLQQRFAARLK